MVKLEYIFLIRKKNRLTAKEIPLLPRSNPTSTTAGRLTHDQVRTFQNDLVFLHLTSQPLRVQNQRSIYLFKDQYTRSLNKLTG